MTAYTTIKLFDLDDAPEMIREATRPVALAHASTVDESAIWEVMVGTYDWRDAVEEWALHRWLREAGPAEGETVLVKLGEPSDA